ncbi:MAG: NUDIX domain-containing protein [Candidatus Saccharimonadaceae bacterium]
MTPSTTRKFENYPGYPTERLVLNLADGDSLQDIDLPDGPWTFNTIPLPTLEDSLTFIDKGYQTDAIGRPLHPWAHTLLQEENGGVVLGKGAYWRWGPNATADPIVITKEDRPRILLIERSDTGALALPGGFVDGNEPPLVAACREVQEETGLEIAASGTLIYQGPVADLRTTLHAWAETSAYLFTVDKPSPVKGNDDALAADWYFVDELPDKLFGSHAQLVKMAMEKYTQAPRDIATILAVPEADREIITIDAGHMAYRHYITTHQEDRIFVKEHDASQFSDPLRESHSRAYLKKEYALYTHLAAEGFQAIPERINLIGDSLLAMEYLSNEDGWHWKAPAHTVTPYTEDVLAALDALQSTRPIDTTEYHKIISPTYETVWREGWDAIDEQAAHQIKEKITEFASQWNFEQQEVALQLRDTLEQLQTRAMTLSRNPQLFPSHNDARQSNIAWHPTKGVRIVDWSWADHAPENADTTMFLIDLAKSGHDIQNYSEKINSDYALTLLGFWLGHSIWDTRDGSTSVREHQVASAATAFRLVTTT